MILGDKFLFKEYNAEINTRHCYICISQIDMQTKKIYCIFLTHNGSSLFQV